jgi:hypothetical protein
VPPDHPRKTEARVIVRRQMQSGVLAAGKAETDRAPFPYLCDRKLPDAGCARK